MVEVGLFLLDQFLEGADVFVLCSFDSEHLIFVVTKNKAVEFCRSKCCLVSEVVGSIQTCVLLSPRQTGQPSVIWLMSLLREARNQPRL